MLRYMFVQVLDDQSVTGALVIFVVAVVSMVFLLLTLLHILLALAVPAYGRHMSSPQERNFVMSPLGLYIVCLFVSNFISAIGGVMELRWIGVRVITQGPTCTTQAFMLQLGNNAAALWTAVISISALRTFMFRSRSLSKLVTLPLIFLLWTSMVVFDGLASMIFPDTGGSGDFFYGIAGMWCWITPNHRMARLFTQYVWMWVWSLVSAVCFSLVFLSVRGNINLKTEVSGTTMRWSKRSFNSYALGTGYEQYGSLVGVVGKTMCWFPIIYITFTVPISVARIAETFGFPVPAYAFVFAAVNVLLLGLANPMLYFAIRHSLKHASVFASPDATLRGSFAVDKIGTESFYIPQDKRLSPPNKSNPYPWTPTPTTKEWAPPSPHRGIGEVTSLGVVAYAMTSEDDGLSAYRTSILSDAPPRQAPVSFKIAQRSRSFHRPMGSISTDTSSDTIVGPSVKSSLVSEGDSGVMAAKLQLSLPPAALVVRRQSTSSPNIISPSEFDRLAYIPLSPTLRSGHRRSGAEASAYSGPRAISPDLNALVQAMPQPPATPTGPPPPPRKTRRSPIPSVPVDVDESDQGSICSARPSVEEFNLQEIRPMSVGDITARTPARRADSMRTFWAAYEGSSPKASDMSIPADSVKRDTMRTFWAAYEDSSPTTPNIPKLSDAASFKHETTLDSKDWKPITPSSADFRRVDSSVFLRPSISAVGRAPLREDTSSSGTIHAKPSAASRVLSSHRRSRSFTPMPTPPGPVLMPPLGTLRPATSAIARYGSPGLAVRDGPAARNTPTPTPSNSTRTSLSDTSYRTPRPQPGYV